MGEVLDTLNDLATGLLANPILAIKVLEPFSKEPLPENVKWYVKQALEETKKGNTEIAVANINQAKIEWINKDLSLMTFAVFNILGKYVNISGVESNFSRDLSSCYSAIKKKWNLGKFKQTQHLLDQAAMELDSALINYRRYIQKERSEHYLSGIRQNIQICLKSLSLVRTSFGLNEIKQ